MTKKRCYWVGTLVFIIIASGSMYWHLRCTPSQSYQLASNTIKRTYEQDLLTLTPYKQEHFALRMFRQTQDPKYLDIISKNILDASVKLNYLSRHLDSATQIKQYANTRLDEYRQHQSELSHRRLQVTADKPEYFFIALDLLRYMARIDSYGLQHTSDQQFRQKLKQYPFHTLFTDQSMTKAWAAQLANQAYWLKQLHLGDYVELYTHTLQSTYPDEQDHTLSPQQYMNKIYGMTHLVIADSGYYQHQINEQDHQWVFDYFRKNINTIINHSKQDIIAEVGVSFLLAGLDNDPVVAITQQAIYASIDDNEGIIPSPKGSLNHNLGEHRNVLAILLLDWHTPTMGPNTSNLPHLFKTLPFGLRTAFPISNSHSK
ncbi:hypothetical protein A9264_11940 [Vibrio sp. UCD-FRSSP16_10]|uniref:DUF3541 domain-containing protein n=1 Tax=unclassified Vibrio TaxID=2614977 RepID=UPI000801DC81|nr:MULTISPECIES: DUF3541 domain-containing protein [unclassified Vibrio]OBT16344.1 hypothetical protein A9260_12150 [Vibrio sp. UCD-FRSSP16_30]OBT21209.1 hypothetical protein A9264_11940 [Vibrio sp. UCD-FRSSP16_10]